MLTAASRRINLKELYPNRSATGSQATMPQRALAVAYVTVDDRRGTKTGGRDAAALQRRLAIRAQGHGGRDRDRARLAHRAGQAAAVPRRFRRRGQSRQP